MNGDNATATVICMFASFEESHYRSKAFRYFVAEVQQHENTLLHYLKLFITTLISAGLSFYQIDSISLSSQICCQIVEVDKVQA
jgi:hypothetical protein